MTRKRNYSRWWTALALAAVASLAAHSAVSSSYARAPVAGAQSGASRRLDLRARDAHIEGSAVRARAGPVEVVPMGVHMVGRTHENIEAQWDGVLHRLWRWMTRAHMVTWPGN